MNSMSDELKDLLERCIWTFIEAATSALVITPALGIDISNLEIAALSGGAAVMSVLKTYAKKKVS